MAFEALLDSAPMPYIRKKLGADVCSLLDLLEGGTAADTRLRAVASVAIDPELLVARKDDREEVLAMLPPTKVRELSRRFGREEIDAQPADFLRALDWTAEQRRELLEFFGFAVEPTSAPQPLHRRPCEPAYGLFPHQRRAAAQVQELLYDGPRRVVLHLPTGVGKTRTGMSLICDHLRRGPTLVIWLAHGQELLEQAAQEFERAWSMLGDRSVSVARMWANAPTDLDGLTDGIVVLGLEKAVAADKSDPDFLRRLAARSSLTTFDEAHQIIAPTFQGIVDALTIRPDASLLGLTATPGRTWADISKDERLSDFFARQKVMLQIEGYTNPVTALIDQGYLARPHMTTVASEAGLHLSTRDQQLLARSFDIPASIITSLATDEQWNLRVIKTIMEMLEDKHRRILVFAASVDHCRLIAAVLTASGIDAAFVTGESSAKHRNHVIARFKSERRRPMVLVNYGVLTTGFDAPSASAAVIARPTKSLVLYSQMVGRVIRGPKAGGTPTCDIVTVVDPDLPGFGDVAEAFINWEDVWEST